MGFTVVTPPSPLSPFVERIWDWEMPPGPHAYERMLPSASAQLIFNLVEDETRVYDDAMRCHRCAGAALDAPSHRSFVIDTAEQVAVVGVVFRPGGGAPLLRERMDLLCNRHVDLDALASGEARTLRQRLLEAKDAAQRLRIVNAWLLRLAADAVRHPAVDFGLRALDCVPQVERIGAIAARCRLSSRRFGELFREQVGMSPKRYARLRRFHQVVMQVHGRTAVDWAGVAVDCGFHDQPHLAREFRAFSGLTPTGYLALQGPYRNHVPLPEFRNLQDRHGDAA